MKRGVGRGDRSNNSNNMGAAPPSVLTGSSSPPSLLLTLDREVAVTFLIRHGLLLRRPGEAGGFWLLAVGAGLVAREVVEGRKEVLQIIQKTPYKEILLKVSTKPPHTLLSSK